jgi:hypothetical protein
MSAMPDSVLPWVAAVDTEGAAWPFTAWFLETAQIHGRPVFVMLFDGARRAWSLDEVRGYGVVRWYRLEQVGGPE